MENRIYISILMGIIFLAAGDVYGMMRYETGKDTTQRVAIYFEFEESRLNETLSDNQKAISLLDSLLSDPSEVALVRSLTICSFVSPDGNAGLSNWLCNHRSEAVKTFLSRRYPQVADEAYRKYSKGEDWEAFRRYIAADVQVPDREDVLMLIDYHRDDVDRRKELIRKLNGGKAYRYIAEHILPKLRRVEIVITREYKVEETPVVRTAPIVNTQPIVESREPSVDRSLENNTVTEAWLPDEDIKKKTGQEGEPRTVLAVKNNLLYDLALAPNIEIEIPVGRRWSINTEYKCPWWMNDEKEFCYQLLSGGVEGRCWLGNRHKRNRLTGHFLGLYAEGGIYDFQFKGDGYQGKYYGAAGLTYGYSRQIARHLALEFSIGVGYLTTEYRKYTPYEGDLVWVNSGRYNFIGPTKAKVSLVWLITTRR